MKEETTTSNLHRRLPNTFLLLLLLTITPLFLLRLVPILRRWLYFVKLCQFYLLLAASILPVGPPLVTPLPPTTPLPPIEHRLAKRVGKDVNVHKITRSVFSPQEGIDLGFFSLDDLSKPSYEEDIFPLVISAETGSRNPSSDERSGESRVNASPFCLWSEYAKELKLHSDECPICRQLIEELLEFKINNGGK